MLTYTVRVQPYMLRTLKIERTRVCMSISVLFDTCWDLILYMYRS